MFLAVLVICIKSSIRIFPCRPSRIEKLMVLEVVRLLYHFCHESKPLGLDHLFLNLLLHVLAQSCDILLVGKSGVRGDELGQQLGVLVVRTDGYCVPPWTEDAHGWLLSIGVLATFVTENQNQRVLFFYITRDSFHTLFLCIV